jgi:thiamine-phosphate diphosphorylase/hydroxyethylthiazole kinase
MGLESMQSLLVCLVDLLPNQRFIYNQLAGGIKSTNILRTLHGAVSTSGHKLDGIAVVSDIVGSTDPTASARKLFGVIRAFKLSSAQVPDVLSVSTPEHTPESIKASASNLLGVIKSLNPLVHQVRQCSALIPSIPRRCNR